MSSLQTSKLRSALEKHAALSESRLHRRHPHAVSWFEKHGIKPQHIRHHAARLTSAAALAGALIMGTPAITHSPSSVTRELSDLPLPQLLTLFTRNLQSQLPAGIRPLSLQEEESVSRLIEIFWGIRAVGTLDGEHLNTTYGYMGAEQHLPRFPGDTVSQHDSHQESGITPGKGAWGYFSDSRQTLTDEIIAKEKWYVAVQTLYLPDWNTRLSYLREWYKYRKVLVINPKNGKTVVADIADAGPSMNTGKSFGGSPEVMAYLDMKDGAQKGGAIIFFVDDKENAIPLGPVTQRRQ